MAEKRKADSQAIVRLHVNQAPRFLFPCSGRPSFAHANLCVYCTFFFHLFLQLFKVEVKRGKNAAGAIIAAVRWLRYIVHTTLPIGSWSMQLVATFGYMSLQIITNTHVLVHGPVSCGVYSWWNPVGRSRCPVAANASRAHSRRLWQMHARE